MKSRIIRRKKRLRRVTNIKIILTLLLLNFILHITHFSMMTFSRYGTNKENAAPVGIAKWDVSINTTNSNNTLNVVAGNTTQNYTFKVKSESEVATTYTIILSDLPNGIQVSIDGGEYQEPINNQIIYNDIGSFEVNQQNIEHEHTLTFNAPLDSDIASTSQIGIDIRFSQVI